MIVTKAYTEANELRLKDLIEGIDETLSGKNTSVAALLNAAMTIGQIKELILKMDETDAFDRLLLKKWQGKVSQLEESIRSKGKKIGIVELGLKQIPKNKKKDSKKGT